ncbi:MAG TPA: signal peptidase I [Methylomirabilota bacterium]|nr:signal peptidase I [Methylomirabilota bacterium]
MAAPQTVTPPEYEPAGESPFSWRAILEIVQALALAVVISVVLNLFVVQVTEVRQQSMKPTLEQNDRVLVSKLDYRFGPPQSGDMIVFTPPIPDPSIPYVKRVIAVGGDVIDLRNGNVFVNGQQLDIPEAHGATQPQAPQIVYPYTVPDGQIFAMGDNRTFSSDSRTFGPVPVGNIIGKVILRFWPFDRAVFFEW